MRKIIYGLFILVISHVCAFDLLPALPGEIKNQGNPRQPFLGTQDMPFAGKCFTDPSSTGMLITNLIDGPPEFAEMFPDTTDLTEEPDSTDGLSCWDSTGTVWIIDENGDTTSSSQFIWNDTEHSLIIVDEEFNIKYYYQTIPGGMSLTSNDTIIQMVDTLTVHSRLVNYVIRYKEVDPETGMGVSYRKASTDVYLNVSRWAPHTWQIVSPATGVQFSVHNIRGILLHRQSLHQGSNLVQLPPSSRSLLFLFQGEQGGLIEKKILH